MQVSVIIPVYNAAQTIQAAVASAIEQPQTAAVILIDDGSTDDSWRICQQLATTYPQVNALQHADRQNHGIGATRNRGIDHALTDYVAFLDADDMYLSGRFDQTQAVLTEFPDTGAIYEAVVPAIEPTASLPDWHFLPEIIAPHIVVPPDQFFAELVKRTIRGFHLNGLTVRREILTIIGGFDSASIGEDFTLLARIAAVSAVRAGKITEPVAIYRIHDSNSFYRPDYNRKKMTRAYLHTWEFLIEWIETVIPFAGDKLTLVHDAYIDEVAKVYRHYSGLPYLDKLIGHVMSRWQLIRAGLRYPKIRRRPVYNQKLRARKLQRRYWG